MRLKYGYSEEGLMPQNGADMLRMLQFLELVHSRVRPHTPGSKARPLVPEKFLLLYTCSTKYFGNYLGCPAPFHKNIPYIGYTQYFQISTTRESRPGNYLNTLLTRGS